MPAFSRFLLSTANVIGCSLALAIAGAFLVGLLGSEWWILAIVAYALGFVLAPKAALQAAPVDASTTATLVWLRDHALPRTSGRAAQVLSSILNVAGELMPRLKEMEAQGIVQSENRAQFKQLLTSHLPDALTAYLKLPSHYANNTVVFQGKTAQLLLVEQLETLEAHVFKIRDGVYSENVNELLANGQFLADKFKSPLELSR